jgi:hypothetical protein
MSKDIRDLLHGQDYSHSMDLRGNPIGDSCVCGCEVFIMLGSFTKGELTFYFLDAECAGCGSLVTLATPLDYEENCDEL